MNDIETERKKFGLFQYNKNILFYFSFLLQREMPLNFSKQIMISYCMVYQVVPRLNCTNCRFTCFTDKISVEILSASFYQELEIVT